MKMYYLPGRPDKGLSSTQIHNEWKPVEVTSDEAHSREWPDSLRDRELAIQVEKDLADHGE